MITLSLISMKGGSGKTSISVHLGVYATQKGMRTLIIDLDPQRSAERWAMMRERINGNNADDLTIVAGNHDNLNQLLKAADGAYDLVIIDTPPRTDAETLIAARKASIVLVPTRPSFFDIVSIQETVDTLEAANSLEKSWVILNFYDPKSKEGEEAKELLSEFDIALCPVVIEDRRDYRKSVMQGKGISEFRKKHKAVDEISRLLTFIKKHGASK